MLQLFEEYVGFVLVQEDPGLGLSPEPSEHSFEVGLLQGKVAALDQELRNRAVGMAVLTVEGDADGGAIVEFDQAGALNVHDEGFEPVRHEKKFQALAR